MVARAGGQLSLQSPPVGLIGPGGNRSMISPSGSQNGGGGQSGSSSQGGSGSLGGQGGQGGVGVPAPPAKSAEETLNDFLGQQPHVRLFFEELIKRELERSVAATVQKYEDLLETSSFLRFTGIDLSNLRSSSSSTSIYGSQIPEFLSSSSPSIHPELVKAISEVKYISITLFSPGVFLRQFENITDESDRAFVFDPTSNKVTSAHKIKLKDPDENLIDFATWFAAFARYIQECWQSAPPSPDREKWLKMFQTHFTDICAKRTTNPSHWPALARYDITVRYEIFVAASGSTHSMMSSSQRSYANTKIVTAVSLPGPSPTMPGPSVFPISPPLF